MELIVDSRIKQTKTHTSVYICGAEVEQEHGSRFFEITLTENLSWSSHITTLVLKSTDKAFFQHKLRQAKFWSKILVNLEQ